LGHPISKDLKANPNDEYKKTLEAIIRCFTCPDMYFEKIAKQAIVGLGTDESSLTRVTSPPADPHGGGPEADQGGVPEEEHAGSCRRSDYEGMLLALLGHE